METLARAIIEAAFFVVVIHTGHTSKEGELAAAIDPRNAVEVYGLKKKVGLRACAVQSI